MNVPVWKRRARRLKMETYVLYLACKDPRVPWYAKVLVTLVVGYVFSPVDPIPDFIPLVGFLDELVVVPVGVVIARRLIPDQVMTEAREKAKVLKGKPVSRKAIAVVVAVWLLIAAVAIALAARLLG